MFADGAQYTARVAHCHHVGGNVFRHDAPGTDHCIVPNGDTRHYDHSSTQPTVASDANRKIVLVCFLPQFRQDRVVCGCKDTVWADHGVFSNVDMGIIHAGQPEVGIDIIAQVNVLSAPVSMKRRLDSAACTALCKHFFQKLRPFCVFRGAGMIVIIQPLHAKFLLCHDGIIRGVVDLLAVDRIFNQHLVALSFCKSFSFITGAVLYYC